MSFVKIHGSILDSSIWSENLPTRIVWITMLAMADEHGVVEASVGGLARRAVVTRDQCDAALTAFLGLDSDSRDGTTGERIEKVPGGWLVLNHADYRDRRTKAQIQTADRVAKHRAKRRAVTGNEVTSGNGLSPPDTEAEAELKAEPVSTPPPAESHPQEREARPEGPKADRVKSVWDHYTSARAGALESLGKRRSKVRSCDATRARVRKLLKHVRESQGVGPDEAAAQVCEFLDSMCSQAIADGDANRFKPASPLFAIAWWDNWISERQGLGGAGVAAPVGNNNATQAEKVWATS